MKKMIALLTLLFMMATVAGCGSSSGDDSFSPGFGEGAENDFDGSQSDGDDYDKDSSDDSGYDDYGLEDFDFEEISPDDHSGVSEGGYENYKDVYRDCNDKIDTATRRFFELFDTDFYDSDAATYHQYMTYYGSFCSPLEDIFSGKDDKIRKSLKEGFYTDNAEWSVNGGKAVITFPSEEYADSEVTITVEYDGSSTAEIIYTDGGNETQRASFITNDQYNIIAYRYDTLLIIDAIYANGDAYFIYDPNGESMDFSVYQGAFDDPAALIGDRQCIAIIDGALIY